MRPRAYIPLKTKALVAVSLKDGVARWTLDDVTVTAPPIADGSRLYLVGEGTLEARQTANGESIWRVPTTGVVSAPLVAQSGWLIVALDNGDLKALKGESGEVVWELALGGVVRTEPLIVGDRLYIAPEGSLLMALDLMTGKTIWERDLGSKAVSIAAHGDRIVAGTVSRMFFGSTSAAAKSNGAGASAATSSAARRSATTWCSSSRWRTRCAGSS